MFTCTLYPDPPSVEGVVVLNSKQIEWYGTRQIEWYSTTHIHPLAHIHHGVNNVVARSVVVVEPLVRLEVADRVIHLKPLCGKGLGRYVSK